MWLLRTWEVGDNDRKKLQGQVQSKPEEFAEQQTMTSKLMDRWRSGRESVGWLYGVV
jgi:hypothetical protein